MTLRNGIALMFALALSSVPQLVSASDSGLITKPSKYSVPAKIVSEDDVVLHGRGRRLLLEEFPPPCPSPCGGGRGPSGSTAYSTPILPSRRSRFSPSLRILAESPA